MRDTGHVAGDRIDPLELERVGGRYSAFARDAGKRRAWAADNPGNVAIRAELLDAIWAIAGDDLPGDGPGDGVLDAGCGGGWWLGALAERGVAPARLHGVDLLPQRVDACRARLPAAVDVRQADVRRLPHPDASFDAVLLLTVLSSLAGGADVARALAEARRVTRPGGLVLVYEPRRRTPLRGRSTHVSLGQARAALGPVDERAVTVWPPVARRLGRLTPRTYPLLAGRRWATSHRLLAHRKAA